jgi:hypothetical protein
MNFHMISNQSLVVMLVWRGRPCPRPFGFSLNSREKTLLAAPDIAQRTFDFIEGIMIGATTEEKHKQ